MKRGIDHLVLCANDLELGAAFYRKLGFTTTPRARHPWGTDNCLIQLTGSFIELLTVSRPSLISAAGPKTFSFGAFNQKFLAPWILLIFLNPLIFWNFQCRPAIWTLLPSICARIVYPMKIPTSRSGCTRRMHLE